METHEKRLADRCEKAMRAYFGTDGKRIGHALSVLGYARRIQAVEGGDPVVVHAAAVLHDIGIPECERKYGSIAGPYQEKEGPPIARRILEDEGMDEARAAHVCDIVADHHSNKRMDTLEFRILWDADWLVNIPNWYPDAGREELKKIVGRVFKTETGRAIAKETLLRKAQDQTETETKTETKTETETETKTKTKTKTKTET